jgi:hypothetical protein
MTEISLQVASSKKNATRTGIAHQQLCTFQKFSAVSSSHPVKTDIATDSPIWVINELWVPFVIFSNASLHKVSPGWREYLAFALVTDK